MGAIYIQVVAGLILISMLILFMLAQQLKQSEASPEERERENMIIHPGVGCAGCPGTHDDREI